MMRSTRGVLCALLAWVLVSCTDVTNVREPVGINVSPTELILVIGEERILGAWLVDGQGKSFSGAFDWSSSDPAVATIDVKRGIVTAVAVGTSTITVSAGALRASALVTVRPKTAAVALAISMDALTIIVGLDEELTAQATDDAGRPVFADIMWSSSNPAVATVEHGRIAARTLGETIITAAVGTLTDTAVVSTITLPSSVSFSRWTTVFPGQFVTDVLSLSPSDAQMRSVPRVPQFESIATPAWSPDGSRLAVEVIHEFTYFAGEFFTDYSSDLYVVDPAASPATPWRALTNNGYSSAPSWSPDGTRIAYLGRKDLFSRNNIFIVDVAEGSAVRLTTTDGNYLTPRWSPDGTRLAFAAYQSSLGGYEIFVVNVDGSGLQNVTRHAADDYDPSWSPDGTQLAFVSTRWPEGLCCHYDVYIMNADGSAVRRLTTDRVTSSSPAWSPDGTSIVYGANDALFVINVDGTSMARLTRPPVGSRDASPAWRR